MTGPPQPSRFAKVPLNEYAALIRSKNETAVRKQVDSIGAKIDALTKKQEATRDSLLVWMFESDQETIARHEHCDRNDGLKYARRVLSGGLIRKIDVAKGSPAGSLLVYIQERWTKAGRPARGVKIDANQLAKRLCSTGMGSSPTSVRAAIARCKSVGVLEVRKAGRLARYYTPTRPSDDEDGES